MKSTISSTTCPPISSPSVLSPHSHCSAPLAIEVFSLDLPKSYHRGGAQRFGIKVGRDYMMHHDVCHEKIFEGWDALRARRGCPGSCLRSSWRFGSTDSRRFRSEIKPTKWHLLSTTGISRIRCVQRRAMTLLTPSVGRTASAGLVMISRPAISLSNIGGPVVRKAGDRTPRH